MLPSSGNTCITFIPVFFPDEKKLKMSPLANCNIKVLTLKLESIDGAKVNIYIFLLVLAFDLLEGRCIDGNTINNNLLFFII